MSMKKKSFLKRLLAVGTSVAVITSFMSLNVLAEVNGSIGYEASYGGFDVFGVNGDRHISTSCGGCYYSKLKVGDEELWMEDDFAFGKNEAKLHAVISLIPRRLINAIIIVAFSLIFRVGIKFLKGLKKSPKAEIKEKSINQVNEATASVTEN